MGLACQVEWQERDGSGRRSSKVPPRLKAVPIRNGEENDYDDGDDGDDDDVL